MEIVLSTKKIMLQRLYRFEKLILGAAACWGATTALLPKSVLSTKLVNPQVLTTFFCQQGYRDGLTRRLPSFKPPEPHRSETCFRNISEIRLRLIGMFCSRNFPVATQLFNTQKQLCEKCDATNSYTSIPPCSHTASSR